MTCEPLRGAHPPRAVRRLVLLVYGLIAVEMAMWVAVIPLAPHYAHDLGLSDARAGALLTSGSVTAVALSLPIGVLSDRLGARRLTIAAGTFLVLGALAQAFAAGFWTLVAARALSGISFAAVWTAGLAWLDVASTDWGRSSTLSGTMVVTAIGMTLGSAFAGVLTESVGVEFPFLAFAAAGLLLTVALARTHAGTGVRAGHVPIAATLRIAGRDRLTLVAVLGTFAAGVATGAANLLVPLQLADSGFGSASLGLVLAASSALSFFVTGTVAAAGDRVVDVRLVGVLLIAGGALFVVPAATVAATPLVAFLLLRGPLNAAVSTVALPVASAGARGSGVGRGAVMGMLSLAWGLATTVSPLAAGAVSDAAGPVPAYAGVAVGAVALGAWAAAGRGGRPVQVATGRT